jgi:hypothetical protein
MDRLSRAPANTSPARYTSVFSGGVLLELVFDGQANEKDFGAEESDNCAR